MMIIFFAETHPIYSPPLLVISVLELVQPILTVLSRCLF
ncbi:hypothetical protein SBF1_1110036 [Candidatus Desulfosporosinus infrequens]|uniref:Uncharacterized protein n=1 Tax=Candidatus Desulfosporosinus infrequens TaxID=2043169 RepID=A0A2U3JYW4_9FIRM|nr:hypothetical protein SBF1_1110036 [Candidatus Desulfosporosinus infrequens]